MPFGLDFHARFSILTAHAMGGCGITNKHKKCDSATSCCAAFHTAKYGELSSFSETKEVRACVSCHLCYIYVWIHSQKSGKGGLNCARIMDQYKIFILSLPLLITPFLLVRVIIVCVLIQMR
ncbi:hypothetical protein, unlikely [Trypanosoma brucei gambiense DAL972]|uniref:Uncharacterized protein n=1 Tax=Trypanosoma brucei gambiense (strain MHOM/CI/86/DAL972) TaxID=679716 RepID=C9ZJX3_TRYB9|nr:hypothetical protein, unlikely [Trypanosoma brucei gambiense DAL972]CBH09737.1 hypothetical protein, unlikely [Trypanosoma brucei gambiense DAL972]|eukprot:XP_011772030.1 hypothetical protein, unlikely [Trypanosoma brucei gambiense DAL972]